MHIINVRIHGSMTLKVSDILGERVTYFLLPSCLCTGCFLGHLCNQFILFLIPPWPSIPSSGDTSSREPPFVFPQYLVLLAELFLPVLGWSVYLFISPILL